MAEEKIAKDAVALTYGNSALEHIGSVASRQRPGNIARIEKTLARAGFQADAEAIIGAARNSGRVTVNFHPDGYWPTAEQSPRHYATTACTATSSKQASPAAG